MTAQTHDRSHGHHNCGNDQENDKKRPGVTPAFPEVHYCSFRTSCKKISRRLSGETFVTVAPFWDNPAAKPSASFVTTYLQKFPSATTDKTCVEVCAGRELPAAVIRRNSPLMSSSRDSISSLPRSMNPAYSAMRSTSSIWWEEKKTVQPLSRASSASTRIN